MLNRGILLFLFIPGVLSIFTFQLSHAVNTGDKAPDFTLTDHKGNSISLSDYAGSVVVLEWTNPDCPFVQRHYRERTMLELEEKYRDNGVVWLAVNSTHYMGAEENSNFAGKAEIPYPILVDGSGEVGKQYGAKTTPHMFIIDRNGNVAYQGGVDDDPRGSSDPSERNDYFADALGNAVNGEEIKVSSSKPYGCSVKYK